MTVAAADRVVIVGASAFGLTAAETLRREGHTGAITLIGDEPDAPYDRLPLSKEILSDVWSPDRLPLRRQVDLDALRLDARYGREAIGMDAADGTVLLSDGTEVPYDGLIVATGVRPRRLPGTPCAHWTTPSPCGTAWVRPGRWPWSAPDSSAPKPPRWPSPWAPA